MSVATAELVRLIDLSLGSQPSGVVNFNYLHTLMHAIVNRLGTIEHVQSSFIGSEGGDVIFDGGGMVATGATGTGTEATGTGTGTTGTGVDGVGSGSGNDGADGTGGTGESKEKEGVDGTGSGEQQTKKEPSTTATTTTPGAAPPPTSDLTESKISTATSSGRTSRAGVHSSGDGVHHPQQYQHRPKSSFVTAANDLGAMERKLQELEGRLNAMDTLPELLERKSSDMGATPIKDRWNFTNLSRRLSAAEDGLEQNSTLVDDLLGEVQNIKSVVTGCESSLAQMGDRITGDISAITEKLKQLELTAAKDSMGEAAAAMLGELQNKIDSLQSELSTIKGAVESLDLSPFATTADLETALQQHSEAAQQSAEAVSALDGRMESMEGDLGRLSEQISELQTTKLNIADMESLMPKGDSDEAATLLPKLMELQSKVEYIEGELGKQTTLPPDVLDQIAAMQKAIDKLTADLASLSSQMDSSSEERTRLEELGSELAQLRERMSEVDRAVSTLTDAVSTMRAASPAEEESDVKYADLDSLTALQDIVNQQQQDHDNLIGTVAHLSNEVEISKEHAKALYSAIDDLRDTKADKDLLEVEVREKADRAALEGKASRDWVDSTFERLDQQIREARDKLLGQEEALNSAVTRLDEDVETKLDRMELEPLKDYFDKKLARVKTAPVEKEAAMAEDAAGFRKPLRFRCISCDKPLGLKTTEAIPALPSVGTLPGTRSFRPYTTYELELIRRHQRMGLPVFGPVMKFSRGPRSAGGTHTLTHSRRRVRVAPLSSAYSPEPYSRAPSRASIHHEVDITGQDGHIYKGRMSTRNKLPPLKSRPTTSPYHQQ